MDLIGKIAVVTGGGRGIGRATALALAGAGAGVCVCARTTAEIEAVAEEVRRLGRPALAVPCDVSDAAQVQALADRTMATLGRADILVNNAGGGQEKNPVGADDVDRWRHTVEVNLVGLYLVTRAFLPHVIADGGGKIINVDRAWGTRRCPATPRMPSPRRACGCLRECWRGRSGSRAWRSTRSSPARWPHA